MRALSFALNPSDLNPGLAAETRPLRNLDEERFRFAPAMVMIAPPPPPRPTRSDSFGRRQTRSRLH
jgi:hypothetical protein